MQNCARQLAMQSCVLSSFVRCGTSKQIEKERKKIIQFTSFDIMVGVWASYVLTTAGSASSVEVVGSTFSS